MEVEISPLRAGVVRIAATGSLDQWTVSQLRAPLLDTADCDSAGVLLDLSELETIDPAGIALLMLARIELEATGRRFVVEVRPSLRRALQRAGVPRFVTFAAERAAALEALEADSA